MKANKHHNYIQHMLTTQWQFTNTQKSNEKSIPYHQTVQIHFTLI